MFSKGTNTKAVSMAFSWWGIWNATTLRERSVGEASGHLTNIHQITELEVNRGQHRSAPLPDVILHCILTLLS